MGSMFIINWWAALLTFVVIGTIVTYMHYFGPGIVSFYLKKYL